MPEGRKTGCRSTKLCQVHDIAYTALRVFTTERTTEVAFYHLRFCDIDMAQQQAAFHSSCCHKSKSLQVTNLQIVTNLWSSVWTLTLGRPGPRDQHALGTNALQLGTIFQLSALAQTQMASEISQGSRGGANQLVLVLPMLRCWMQN